MRNFNKYFSLISVFLLLICVSACSNRIDKHTKIKSQNYKQEKKKTKNSEKIFNVGDKIKIDDGVFEITEFKKIKDSKSVEQKKGKEFVQISVKIKKPNSTKLSYNSSNFKVKDRSGNVVNASFVKMNQNSQLNNGELRGTLKFEVTTNDKLELLYQPNFAREKPIKVKLN